MRDKYSSRSADTLKRLPSFKKDIARLRKGEPLAYVIGWVDFLGCRIDLSHKPLIPRPETEWWTEKAIAAIAVRGSKSEVRKKKCAEHPASNAERPKPFRVLDLFAGSGCVGLAVLKHIPEAKVDFADIDKNALAQIRKNLKLNKVPSRRYRVKHSNILQNVGMFKYDYILANPPYISESRKRKVERSVRKYEPAAALWGGRDGLAVIRKFLKQAGRHLAPGGRIYMEFDAGQKAEIMSLARKSGYRAAVHKDQFGKWRYARLLPLRPPPRKYKIGKKGTSVDKS